MEECQKLIKFSFPKIDDVIFDYVDGVLKLNQDDFESPDDIFEAVGEFFIEISKNDKDEEDVRDVCAQIWNILGLNGKKQNSTNGIKVLSAPVQMSSLINDEVANDLSSIWLSSAVKESTVDQKKLQKAEQKLQQKQEKRLLDSKSGVPVIVECQASAAQVISKKESKQEAKGSALGRFQDIKIENFDVAFGERVLIQGATITLAFGRRYGFIGRNGLGKSTLLTMISSRQLKIPPGISILHVEQEVVGDDTLAMDSVLEALQERTDLLKEKALLESQNSSEASQRLSEIYSKLVEYDSAPAQAAQILHGLGFSQEGQKMATRTFSGGWRMRLALARALFSKPDLLLLDEPTNMLDLKAIIWLENYLQGWSSTLLVVSHDRHFLDEVATDILYLHSQVIDHYKGNYENFVKTRSERLKNQQREFDAQQLVRSHTQEFIDKFRYNAKRASLVQSKIKFLEKLPELKPVEKDTEVILRFPEVENLNPPVLQVEDLIFGYYPETIVLNKVNLSANMDSRICVVGENGTGKSTLLKLVLGDLTPIKGYVHKHKNMRIGYFTQHHLDQLDTTKTPVGFLQQKFPGSTVEEYRRRLGKFGISGDLALQSIASLSGGQKSRVAFATMCYPNPNFLILDEVTNHLDVETIEALSQAIHKFNGGVILVSHDEQMIRNVCKEVWICGQQQVKRLEGGFTEYREAVEKELDCVVYK